MQEKRIIGVDFGDKRVGVAITDPLGLFAQPLCTLGGGKRAVIAELLKLIDQYSPEAVVIGLPVEMSGIEGEQAVKVRAFAEQLEKRILATRAALKAPAPSIKFFDERLTTVEAGRILRRNDVRGSSAKDRVDQVSAAVILEGFLHSL